MEDMSFWKWYTETEKIAGSLVTPTMAGKLLGTTRQYIQNLMYQGKMTKYEYDSMTLVGMNEINQFLAKRQEKILKDPRLKRAVYISAKEEKKEDFERFLEMLKDIPGYEKFAESSEAKKPEK